MRCDGNRIRPSGCWACSRGVVLPSPLAPVALAIRKKLPDHCYLSIYLTDVSLHRDKGAGAIVKGTTNSSCDK